jgi:hypothetical protein
MTSPTERSSKLSPQFLGFLMVVIFLFNALIFPSIAIFVGNQDDFSASLMVAMRLHIVVVAVIAIASVALLLVLSPKARKLVAILFAWLSVLVWVQSVLLVGDYGVLDGRSVEWGMHWKQSLIDSSVWVLFAVAFIFIMRKHASFFVTAAVFVFILQLVSSAYTVFQASAPIMGAGKNSTSTDVNKVLGFSKESNVLHIVADGFQSDVFQELINNPQLRGGYNKSFSGFVFYRETLGIFPYTRFSVPAFLSGKIYSNEAAKNEYIDNALKGDTIISVAKSQKYEVDIVADGDYLIGRYVNLPHNNIFDINDMEGIRNPFSQSAMLLDMSIFRIVPGPIKPYVYNNQKWLMSRFVTYNDLFRFRYFTNTIFLNYLIGNMTTDRDAPVYKYLHIMNTHNPMVVSPDCGFTGGPVEVTRVTLTVQSMCTMATLAKLMERMKALDIYDSTMIVIHGDHGGWIGNQRSGPDIVFPDGQIGDDWIKSLASPLLAIKPRQSEGDIKTSNVLASITDVPDTLSDIMGWDAGFGHVSLTGMAENDRRTRQFRYYRWQNDAWATENTGPILQFEIDGSHYESEWKPVIIFNPPR